MLRCLTTYMINKGQMKKLILLITILLAASCRGMALNFSNEKLHYNVEYKWGLVNKTAGKVTISLSNTPDRYKATLLAATEPWADHIYKVRDTLSCEIIKNGFLPVIYEKRAHEGSDRKLDIVRYSRSGGVTTGSCVRKAWKDGRTKRDETRTIIATGKVVDMLSAFYFMRQLPYQSWQSGHKEVLTVFSGKRKEVLTIKYFGTETVEYNKKSYNCYHIKFTFTSDGKKKTSDDMEAWISTDRAHIPVKLQGKLPIGSVRCFYTG